MYPEICSFLLDFPIYLNIDSHSIPWISLVFIVTSSFSFLILLIWVFPLLILVRFARGLSILFIFPKNQLFVLLILCLFFLVSYFVGSGPYFYYFFPSCFGFSLFCFSRSLRCTIRLFIWDLSVDRGVLKSPNATVLGSICGFKSFSVCLIKLGAYKLIIVISSLLVWSDLLHLFWIILVWSPLCLIQVSVLLAVFGSL
jgi:hypothetical protein